MSVQQAAHAYVGAFVEEMARAGVEHVCICPGSRSTPLAMLCADHPRLRVWMHIDERSAAFFALGMAKATGRPVALVATSGTAVVNFMPAVVEAFFSRVPLLVLTADRPPELRDVGTNQTIDQVRLYGTHVKWFVDMPLPEMSDTMVRYARMAATRAVATSLAAPAGPVHLNFPLREPLIPRPATTAATDATLSVTAASAPSVPVGPTGFTPAPVPLSSTQIASGLRTLPQEDVAELARQWAQIERGVIVCGPDTPAPAARPIISMASALGWPVLVDPLSGMRAVEFAAEAEAAAEGMGTAGCDTENADGTGAARTAEVMERGGQGLLVDAYDVFLRFEEAIAALAPEFIVRFGALPVSKPLQQYLQRYASVPQVVVDEGAGWRDPMLAAGFMLHADPAWLCTTLAKAVVGGQAGGDASGCTPAWATLWQRLNVATRRSLREATLEQDGLFEGRVFQELAELLPAGAALYVGNSMPIRDMDAFFPVVDRPVHVFGNRGASGIDGIVSSALGVSAGWDGPVVLVLGDLSFYHDLNGLLAAKLHQLNATIVVINNDGGGIFSFLPQAEEPKHFELLFGTPIGLDFEPVVRMYGGTFTRVENWEQFQQAVAQSVGGEGLHIVEIVSERARNVVQHREVFARARTAVAAVLKELGAGRVDASTAAEEAPA